MTEKDSQDEQIVTADLAAGGHHAAPASAAAGEAEPTSAAPEASAAPLQAPEADQETAPIEDASATPARAPVTLIAVADSESGTPPSAAPHAEPAPLTIPDPHWPEDPVLPGPKTGPALSEPAATSAPSGEPAVEAASALEAGPRPETAAAPQKGAWAFVKKAGRFAVIAAVCYLALILLLIPVYRVVNPPASTLMLTQWLTLNSVDQTWIPLEEISPNLVRAVVVSEDDRFCAHNGIDLEAMAQAIEHGGRGASTISMQVTKNLFLWSSRSYVRKLIEIPITLLTELVWPKWRILELYLNVAEWGPGIFGAEAAARHHFNKSAARLSASEAALLAASLPNPYVRDAGDPGPRTAAKGRVVQARMRAYGNVAACVTDRYAPATPEASRDNVFRPARRPQAPAGSQPRPRRDRPSDNFFDSKPPL